MRIGKDQICVVRALPRHTEAGQRAALEPDGCGDWIALHEPRGLDTLISRLRRGDVVKVRALHLLAPPKDRTDDNPRLELWSILHLIEDRGATVREVSTGRSTADKRERDDMIADAIEVITRGARAYSRKLARENGKKGGRPPKTMRPEQTGAARALWFSVAWHGVELRKELKRYGYSLSRCYREFGARKG